jgi:hypothetical protein
MTKFMFLHRGGDCDRETEMISEQQQERMKGWMDWVKQGTDTTCGVGQEGKVNADYWKILS